MAKNEAYRHEDETRGYICVLPDQYKFVKFRKVNNYIVPYIQMPLPKDAVKKNRNWPNLECWCYQRINKKNVGNPWLQSQ